MNCPRCSARLKSTNPLLEKLSSNQFQIARRFAMGQNRSEVAAAIGITKHCASQTLLIVKDKLGVRNDVELALLMLGLLDQAHQAVEEMDRR
jgi:DNA-binding CsgD family transcriptional regulator